MSWREGFGDAREGGRRQIKSLLPSTFFLFSRGGERVREWKDPLFVFGRAKESGRTGLERENEWMGRDEGGGRKGERRVGKGLEESGGDEEGLEDEGVLTKPTGHFLLHQAVHTCSGLRDGAGRPRKAVDVGSGRTFHDTVLVLLRAAEKRYFAVGTILCGATGTLSPVGWSLLCAVALFGLGVGVVGVVGVRERARVRILGGEGVRDRERERERGERGREVLSKGGGGSWNWCWRWRWCWCEASTYGRYLLPLLWMLSTGGQGQGTSSNQA